MPNQPLAESRLLAEAATTSIDQLGRRQRLLLISEGWGSSGYYSADVLRRAAPLFEAGIHQYIDHPTRSEDEERPERSLRDLAAVLDSTAVYDPAERGLFATNEVLPAYQQFLAEMKKHIGVSIRASGTVEYGQAEGREGPIVTAITSVESVDFVTKAGRGGRIVELLESARAQALAERGTWKEQDHPRGYHGRFGHGGGASHTGSDHGGGGSSGHTPTTGAGSTGGGGGSGRGMPSVLATTEVPLKSGGTLTVDRHQDGDRITLTHNGHTTAMSRDNAHTLARQLDLADDWDKGDEESFDGVGRIHKTGAGQYEVTLHDGATLNLTRRDNVKLEQALDGLDSAARVDTGNGDLDVYSPARKKIAFRMLGTDGTPVEAVFDRASWTKVDRAIDRIIDDIDDPDITNPTTKRELTTNLGKVSVEIHGTWTGGRPLKDRLEILPEQGDWGIVVDGPQQRDWHDAVSTISTNSGISESAAPPAVPTETTAKEHTMPVPLAESRNIGAWIESRLHLAFTQLADDMYGNGRLTREERISLSGGINQALMAFTAEVQAAQPQLFQRDLYDDPDAEEAAPAAMSEAARRLAEATGITANDLRDALNQALRDTYGGKDIWVWVRDYTDEWVVFSLEDNTEPSDGGLFQQPFTLTGRTVTLTGEPAEVTAVTTYEPQPEPADRGTGTTTNRTAPGTAPGTAQMEEGAMPEMTEEQARQLAEAATLKTSLNEAIARLDSATGQIAQLTERADAADARADAADAKAQRLENEKTARRLVTEALKNTPGIPAASQGRLIESVLRDLPTTDTGGLDTDAFTTVVESAITDKQTEIASLLEESGAGHVRGLGESRAEPLTESDFETSLAESFQRLGLSDDAAKIAATGRR
ncbi:hypothetical protein JOL79_11345 [Microbispora sp. RL4-1S]|uniref:Uncharacterized protein n=1 Tax=Microbispora oryzae TaxID=2806554 RepID=A0A940WGL0_9ACTN|nr:hypothetical protein [Microbispora oryzae]MBP2704408.1 hypothetical protein [Microbispora oryzae]